MGFFKVRVVLGVSVFVVIGLASCSSAEVGAGKAALEREEFGLAAELFRTELARSPENAEVQFLLGRAIMSEKLGVSEPDPGDLAAAFGSDPEPLDHFLEALRLDPDFEFGGWGVGIGQGLLQAGRLEEAKSLLTRAAGDSSLPNAVRERTVVSLAECLLRQGEPEEVVSLLEPRVTAGMSDSNAPVARLDLARAYTKLGEFEKAEGLLKQVVSAGGGPSWVPAHFYLAAVYDAQSKTSDAIFYYRETIRGSARTSDWGFVAEALERLREEGAPVPLYAVANLPVQYRGQEMTVSGTIDREADPGVLRSIANAFASVVERGTQVALLKDGSGQLWVSTSDPVKARAGGEVSFTGRLQETDLTGETVLMLVCK